MSFFGPNTPTEEDVPLSPIERVKTLTLLIKPLSLKLYVSRIYVVESPIELKLLKRG